MIKAYVTFNSETAKENAEIISRLIDENANGRTILINCDEAFAREIGAKLRYVFESRQAAIEAGADEDGISTLKSGRVAVDPLYL